MANIQRIIETPKPKTVDVEMRVISTKKRTKKKLSTRYIEIASKVDFYDLKTVSFLLKIERVSFFIAVILIIFLLPAILVLAAIDTMMYHNFTIPSMILIMSATGTYILNQIVLVLIYLNFKNE